MSTPRLVLPATLSRRRLLAGGVGVLGAALLDACAGAGSSSSSPTTGGSSGSSGSSAGSTGTSPSPTSSAGTPTRGGTARVGAIAPTAAVDPVTMYDSGSIAVAQQSAEYLVYVAANGSLTPVLATSWAPSDSARTWIFKLRPGVRFHDGSTLSAKDVVATFDRLVDPKSESSALTDFQGILQPGGIRAVDDLTVRFQLKQPYADFPYLVSSSNYNTLVLPRSYSGDFQSKPVGTGPFIQRSFTQNQGAEYTKNPDYWGKPRPYLDGVKFTFYQDDQAQLLGLQGNEINTVVTYDASDTTALASDSKLSIESVKGSATFTLWMRVDKHPFSDQRVRQAVAWAIDRKGLLSTVLDHDHAVLGNDHFFGPTMPVRPTNLMQRTQNLAKARQLLHAAGATGQKVTLTTENDGPAADYATLVKSDLAKIGLTVDLNVMSQDAFYGSGSNQPWLEVPFGIVDWASRAIPEEYLDPVLKTGGVWNSPHYSNPALDQLLARFNATTDHATR
ncbi:MAG TPA: ABC transporter substrate-binding protein, partial [Acidimicrobiales bacterium]|nr:ABC transporter substrate-binding protein [Acidimicrobiales bacterium]